MRLNEKLETQKTKDQERRSLLKAVRQKWQLERCRKAGDIVGIIKLIQETRP